MRPVIGKNIALVLLLALGACAKPLERGDPLPAGRFHFPTGVALTPEGAGIPQRLLVVSSNTDLRFRSGLLHAFDREAIDRLVDDAAAGCTTPDCPPVEIFDLRPAVVGTVEVGDLAGQVAAVALEGENLPPVRAFVPVRGTGTVVAADLDEAGIRCSRSDGKCIDGGAVFPREDPFLVVAGLGNVFVGHGSLFRDRRGAVGVAAADAPFWSTGEGGLIPIDVGTTAIGGLAIGGCRQAPQGDEVCTLFANGRSRMEGNQQILAFGFRRGAFMTSPLFSRNLAPVQDGTDSRGIDVSTSGEEVFLANRFPDALATVDVTRLPSLPADGCVLSPGEVVPEGEACPDLPPSTGDTLSFANLDLSPAPRGPLTITVIPRPLPAGGSSDLVVMTTEASIAFFDAPTGAMVANLTGLGGAPVDVAVRQRGAGVRLYVPFFGRGTVAVIDVADLFRPEEARVVAILGQPQEDQF